MNVIYYYNLTANNGWRWRFEIITSDTTLLSSPTYVEIPEGVIQQDIKWSAKFPNVPIGLSDTPSVNISFCLAYLGSSPELINLRTKLDSPFLNFDAPIASVPASTTEVYNYETGEYEIVNIPAYSAQVTKIRLSNVLRIMTNYGNDAVTFDNMHATDDNAINTTIVFSGVQSVSPPSSYNHKNKCISIEFMHLNRYVLEQINPSMVDVQMGQTGARRARSVIMHGFKGATPYAVELHQTSGDQESFEAENIWLYKVDQFFSAINVLFTDIRKYIIRQDGFTWYGFDSYLQHCRFYRQNLLTGLQGAALNKEDLYFIGRVFAPSTDGNKPELIGGTFSTGSKFYSLKNMFDFFVDICECGTKAIYIEFSLIPQLLTTTTELPPNGALELNADNIGLNDESERQFGALGGYECDVAGANIAVSNFGRAQSEDTFNFAPYFHNVFQEFSYSFSPDNQFSALIRGMATDVTQLEGQLFYADGSKTIAVHPACDYKNSPFTYTNDLFSAPFTIDPNASTWFYAGNFLNLFLMDKGFSRITEKINEYINRWRGEIGVARRIGYEIISNLSSDKQRKFSGTTILTGWISPTSAPLPRNVGRIYTIGAGLFDHWLDVPTSRVFLLSSELDIVKGVAQNEFFAQDIPITISFL
jgi:hypothetical protein